MKTIGGVLRGAGSPGRDEIKLYGREFAPFEKSKPKPAVAEEMLLHPSDLEDTYGVTPVYVERAIAQKAATPERVFGFDELVDFLWAGETYLDKLDQAERTAELRRRKERERRREARERRAAWVEERRREWTERKPPPLPVPPLPAPTLFWTLTSGVTVSVTKPRYLGWGGLGRAPARHQEECRLRDFADAVERGPIAGATGTEEEAREIADGIAGLRELADQIRAERERNG